MSWWLLAAIAAAVITTQLVGFLWYGVLFAKPWMDAMGWNDLTDEQKQEKQQGAMPGYIASAVMSAAATGLLWIALVSWDLLNLALDDLHPAIGGALFGLMVWSIGYLPGTFVSRFFEDTHPKVWAIGAGYWAVLTILWGLYVGLFSLL